MFENNICFDLLNVLDGKPKYANVPLSKLFARPCVDRPEVLDGGPDYATALLLEFFSRAKCPLSLCHLESQQLRCMAERRRVFKQNVSLFFFFHFFFFLVFFCQSVWYGCSDVFVMGLSWLFGRFYFV